MSLLGYALINGTAATFRRVTPGEVDIETGIQATTTADTAVHLIPASLEVGEVGEIDTDEMRCRLVAAEITGADPDTEDLVIVGSSTYEIISSKPVKKRDAVVFYELSLRRVA